ncbi:HAD-IC family P-type ATPase [Candidatus Saccharibacteria bacterium]|nr:HAD-IC family P-type ATPase [Candidatus Saccharibacteria bacterium]
MQLWHTLNLAELFHSLGSSEAGLSSEQASHRLSQYGYNELPQKKLAFWKKLLEPFKSIFIMLLLAAAAISFISGKQLDGTIIAVIIAINMAIYYSQQQATNRVIKSLKKHSEQIVQVLRDGQIVNISSRLLVPGDVIILGEGQKIPADARLIHQDNLFMDEAALTGESLPVKKAVSILSAPKQLYERDNMVFSGTYVLSGAGRAMVTTTGSHTEFGAIAKLAIRPEPKSPVQQKIDAIVSKLIKVLAILAVAVFGLSLARGIELNEALRFVLSFSVSAIPEDLPIAMTIVLVLGMRRMAKYNALVRSTDAIENLGLITVVAVDKTGTLTKNRLEIAAAWTPSQDINLSQVSYHALGDENVLEPFDKAIKRFAQKDFSAPTSLIKKYPFNQQQRASGALWNNGGKKTMYLKGAPEHLLNLCRLSGTDTDGAENQLRSLVAKGFRVIALASAEVDSTPENLDNLQSLPWKLQGLLAFADELRPESQPAIAAAQAAGVSVKMITGDHFDTAFHIGRLLNISPHKEQVVQGSELPATEEELVPYVKQKTVFARILPNQKFNILSALKRSEITAMTGDGVNDVPALVNANVGIAMAGGSDIAKDAGDIILLDNNFASIVRAISEGRIIYDNIRKMLFYLLATTLGEVLTIIGALAAGLPLPVTAIMILWINLVTDTALVIPLGLEPPEADHMNRPPRHPRAPILDRLILTRIVLVGIAMSASILGVFAFLIQAGYSSEYAQTIAFAMLVFAQWVNAFNARSERQSLIRRLFYPNYKLLVGLALAATAQALAMFSPLKNIFGVQSVELGHLLSGLAITGVSVYLTAEVHKFVKRSTD